MCRVKLSCILYWRIGKAIKLYLLAPPDADPEIRVQMENVYLRNKQEIPAGELGSEAKKGMLVALSCLFVTPWSVASVHGILQARILGWVANSLPQQGIFPAQGSNPGLPYCKQTLYCQRYQGSLRNGGTPQKVCN